ncbi:MAG: hypothetical protein R3B70_27220 [Polyangiaceae bacterium]
MSTEGIQTSTFSRLAEYALCWLFSHEDGGTEHKMAQVLFKEKRPGADSRRLIAEEMARLRREGHIASVRRSSFTVTAAGKQAALGLLGWSKPPKAVDWRAVKARLETCLLEREAPSAEPPAQTHATLDEKTAEALAKALQLDLGPSATGAQVLDGVGWYALGIKTTEPFTREAALETLLSRLAGSATRLSLPQAISKLLAAGTRAAPPLRRMPVETAPRAPMPEEDKAFAARVLAAANASKTGRFGRDKVFISHVVQQLAREGADVGDVEGFKTRLVAAHRRKLLSLSRADMIEAMNPQDVDESETRHLNATFHFVKIG